MSVVIPARDDAVALTECLARLRRQTVLPWEVVVVDNGSSDDTAAVAAAWGARVVSEARVGIPAAASTGYDRAAGDVIARLDADSRPDTRWVERIAASFGADPALDAVTGSGLFFDLPPVVRGAVSGAYLGAYYGLCHLALGHTALWGSSMAMRRESWLAVRSRGASRRPGGARRPRPRVRARATAADPVRPRPAGGDVRALPARALPAGAPAGPGVAHAAPQLAGRAAVGPVVGTAVAGAMSVSR